MKANADKFIENFEPQTLQAIKELRKNQKGKTDKDVFDTDEQVLNLS